MGLPQFAIQNLQQAPNALTDKELSGYVPSLQKYLNGDFGQDWWFACDLHYATKTDDVSGMDFVLKLQDTLDVQGALGYHTKGTTPKGFVQYFGYVGIQIDLQAGAKASITIAHELAEAAADRSVSRIYYVQTGGGFFAQHGENMAAEVADAPEADQFGYQIDGIWVSDFVHEEWFTGDPRSDGRYSFQGHCTKPWQILPGGYIGVQPVGRVGQWTTINAQRVAQEAEPWECHQKQADGSVVKIHPPMGSRRWRRERDRQLAMRALQSTP